MTGARCIYCSDPVDERTGYRHVQGWERKTRVRSSGTQGGSDIACREPLGDEWACMFCIEKKKRGLSVGQSSML